MAQASFLSKLLTVEMKNKVNAYHLAHSSEHRPITSILRTRLFTVPYFSLRSYMPIVEFDGPPSWSLDTSETGESTKCLWEVVVGLIALPSVPSTIPTHRHFVLSPVSLTSRDQDSGLSNLTIDIYDLREK